MQSVLKLVAWIVIIVLAAVLMFFVMKLLTQPDQTVVQPVVMPKADSVTPPVESKHATVSTEQPELLKPIGPISIANSSATTKGNEVVVEDTEKEARKKAIEDTRSRLYALMKDPSSLSPKDVDKVIADMSVLKDEKGLVGGVSLEALRATLKISDEMQALALEIQAESELGEHANSTKLLEQSQKMEQLQKKLLEASDAKKLLPGS